MYEDSNPIAPSRGGGTAAGPPRLVIAVAVAAMVLGFFTTPEVLIALGPMRTSLTSEIPSVRSLAQIELMLFRVACLAVAVLPYFWAPLASSAVVRRIHRHEPREEGPVGPPAGLFNFSLIASLVCTTLGLAYVGLGARIFTRAQLVAMNREDGVIEYASASIFLVCSLLSAALAFRRRSRNRPYGILVLFAFVFFAMCGEEISWGQRILEVETLDVFKGGNVQNENNLHNMFGYMADHLFILGVFVYGVVFPVLNWKYPFFRRLFDYVGLPIASLGLAVGFLAISGIHEWTVGRVMGRLHGLRVAELRELLSAIGFLLLLVEAWRRTTKARPAAVEPATATA